MLTQSLQVSMTLGDLQVRPSRLDMQIQKADVFRYSELRVTSSQFSMQISDAATINIDTRAIQEELGFRRPIQFVQYTLGRSRSGAQAAISKNVSKGDLYLDNPESATQTLATQAGAYSAQTQIAMKPKNMPSIQFSPNSEITIDHSEGSIDIAANSSFDLSFNFQPASISLSRNPSVNVRLVSNPGAGRRLDLNV